TGLGVRRVRRALRLANLALEVQNLLEAGQITEGVALEIASIETHGEQIACVKELGSGEASPKRARALAAGYHLTLLPERAGFDPADPRFAPMPCNRCPKNTVTQRELWADGGEEEAGKCTDRTCYRNKQEQSQEIRADEARARGIPVIQGEDAEKLYPQKWYDGPTDGQYVDLDANCPYAETKDRVSYRDLLGPMTPTAIVNVHGKTRELVSREDVAAALERKGLEKVAEREREIIAELSEDDEEDEAAEDARKKEYERDNRIHEETRKRTRDAIHAFALDAKGKAWLRFLARLLVDDEAENGGIEWAARALGIKLDQKATSDDQATTVGQWVDASERTECDLRDLILELVLGRNGYNLMRPAKLAGVDREKIAEQVASELR
ncbi:MAG TPA: hypothetical protein VM580_21620, partial [Labilithrix sp.]|nr:hypothetical protein [Labilithrix sp.]